MWGLAEGNCIEDSVSSLLYRPDMLLYPCHVLPLGDNIETNLL